MSTSFFLVFKCRKMTSLFFEKTRKKMKNMNGVLSASKLMTAAEVRKACAEMRSNPALLLATELKEKSKLFAMSTNK